MNCPRTISSSGRAAQLQGLPVRYSTYDVLHRNEVERRALWAHAGAAVLAGRLYIYLMEEQIPAEVKRIADFILAYYNIRSRSKLKSPRDRVRIGDDASGPAPRRA